jgi:hypothetical protein
MIPNHRRQRLFHSAALTFIALTACFVSLTTQAEDAKPNIMFIMGDDIGWMQLSSYQQGLGLGHARSAGHPLAGPHQAGHFEDRYFRLA